MTREVENEFLETALEYTERGWSIIPLFPRTKKPTLKSWIPHQHKCADRSVVQHWWTKRPQLNIGVVTGAVSNLVVLDVDGEKGRASAKGLHLPPTPTTKTGKGFHYYYHHPGFAVSNAVELLPGIDLRGDGGYVVAPPSIHPLGKQYRWAPYLAPGEVDLAPCPEWLLEQIKFKSAATPRSADEWRRLVDGGAEIGQRNDSVASLAGHLLRRGLDPHVTLLLIRCWNAHKNKPPLPEDEVVRTVNSIAGKELIRRKGGSDDE